MRVAIPADEVQMPSENYRSFIRRVGSCVPDYFDFGNSSPSMIDVTSYDTLMYMHMDNQYDYGVFRDSISAILVPQWNTLSFEDRKNCVEHYRYPSDITDQEWYSYFTDEEHETNWNILTAKTRDKVRLLRLFAAFQKISYRMNESQVAVIYMVTKEFCYDYYYANLPHLLLWITNGSYPALGIDFTNNGFAQMNGYTESIRNELLNIFVNGNYEYGG